jgi:hypothetical protein
MSSMRTRMIEAEGMVTQHPMSTALVVFGIGLGVGVAVGSLLAGTPAPPTLTERAEHAAEKLGRQMLDAIAGVIPQTVSRHVS